MSLGFTDDNQVNIGSSNGLVPSGSKSFIASAYVDPDV